MERYKWALSFYGLIPEASFVLTSVSTRQTKSFRNVFGTFTYRHLKQGVFDGYDRISIDGRMVLMATPEKALVDLWYIEPGSWDMDRMREMRFQNLELVKQQELLRYAQRRRSPKIDLAVKNWIDAAERENEGTVEL